MLKRFRNLFRNKFSNNLDNDLRINEDDNEGMSPPFGDDILVEEIGVSGFQSDSSSSNSLNNFGSIEFNTDPGVGPYSRSRSGRRAEKNLII